MKPSAILLEAHRRCHPGEWGHVRVLEVVDQFRAVTFAAGRAASLYLQQAYSDLNELGEMHRPADERQRLAFDMALSMALSDEADG